MGGTKLTLASVLWIVSISTAASRNRQAVVPRSTTVRHLEVKKIKTQQKSLQSPQLWKLSLKSADGTSSILVSIHSEILFIFGFYNTPCNRHFSPARCWWLPDVVVLAHKNDHIFFFFWLLPFLLLEANINSCLCVNNIIHNLLHIEI
ncbi:unnamed protein product [Heterosigma akashiwo]